LKGEQTKNSQGGREIMAVPGAGTGLSVWQSQAGVESSRGKARQMEILESAAGKDHRT